MSKKKSNLNIIAYISVVIKVTLGYLSYWIVKKNKWIILSSQNRFSILCLGISMRDVQWEDLNSENFEHGMVYEKGSKLTSSHCITARFSVYRVVDNDIVCLFDLYTYIENVKVCYLFRYCNY